MKKIVEREGHKYSTESFEGYEFRAKFVVEGHNHIQFVNMDVYTTNTDKAEVEEKLTASAKKRFDYVDIKSAKVVHWASKEQDDLMGEFIDEFILND